MTDLSDDRNGAFGQCSLRPQSDRNYFNNGGYGTFRPMLDGTFNDVQPWKYAEIGRVIGQAQGHTVSTEDELLTALLTAKKNGSSPSIIDVQLEKYDCSERLRRLTDNLKKRIK